jgi:hypothetical protein
MGSISYAYRPRWINCFLIERSSTRLCGGSVSAYRGSAAATLLDLYPEGIPFECLLNYWLTQGGFSYFSHFSYVHTWIIFHGQIIPNYYLHIVKRSHLSPIHRTSRMSGFAIKKSWILGPKIGYPSNYSRCRPVTPTNLLGECLKEIRTVFFHIFYIHKSRDISVAIATGYGLDSRSSIPRRDKRFFCSP